MKTAILSLAVAMALPLAVKAEEVKVQAYNDFYIGVAAGQAEVSINDAGNEDFGKTLKLFGGYMFTPNLGMEVSYTDVGDGVWVDWTDCDSDGCYTKTREFAGNVYTLSLVTKFKLIGDAHFIGNLGYHSTTTDLYTVVDYDYEDHTLIKESNSEDGFYGAIGLGYDITESLAVQVKYDIMFLDAADVTNLSLGIVYKF
ncbi:outer membrane beta-barrel protein [Colwellia psychrerythraea]|uniref:Outer membrane protein beta-barrel domain-containing protein n=1 Tax=Colwellia psychrerythraea TaxID=28229 RepID=A0A099L1T1_COLPS|nr:outer membrane beta-barrel protein [Colwellia psychrerythraea]KGJ96405.1 hypothetical protein GAB14E_0352 [Colwellia psychrerythraea]